ncbi:hypothetical protein INR49_016318 [Caranx melampygus]|nr:hypothetical protein INR49_016318 [Caranx melampygus]
MVGRERRDMMALASSASTGETRVMTITHPLKPEQEQGEEDDTTAHDRQPTVIPGHVLWIQTDRAVTMVTSQPPSLSSPELLPPLLLWAL